MGGGSSAGFLQFMQDQQARDRQQAEIAALQQQMRIRQQQADFQSQSQARSRDATQGWGPLLANMQPPPAFQPPPQMPQPPAPGTNSAQPPAPPQMSMAPQPPNPMLPPPPQMTPAPAAAPKPDPWRPMPTAPAPQPGGGGAQQLPPPPGAPPGGAGGMPPMPQAGNADQFALPNLIKMLKEGNVPPEKWGDMLDNLPEPVKNNAAQQIKMMHEQQAQLMQWANLALSGRRADQGDRRIQQADTEEQRKRAADRVRADQGQQRINNKKNKGGTPGNPGIAATGKDELADDATRIQAWQYIMKGTLPYRKGTGGGKDANQKVMNEVAKIGKELNMSPEEIVAKPADWKANAQSLAFQTKKLDAIEGTLSSFHNNVDTWNSIAKGKAPELGGARVADMAKNLSKINFSDVKTFNDIKLRIGQEFNDPTIAAYMTSAMAVAMDFARIMQGPQSVASLTEGARADAQRLIAAGLNDKARAAVIGSLESDAAGQVKGIKDQLTTIKGRMGLTSGEKKADPVVRAAPGPTIDQSNKGPKMGEKRTINGTPAHWDGHGWLAD